MNAANASLHASALENERRAHEPSMEEILASIRRIIADDDALPLTRPTSEFRSTFDTPKPFEKPRSVEAANVVDAPEALETSDEFAAPTLAGAHETAGPLDTLMSLDSANPPETNVTVLAARIAPAAAEGHASLEDAAERAAGITEELTATPNADESVPDVLADFPGFDESDLESFAEIAQELASKDLTPAPAWAPERAPAAEAATAETLAIPTSSQTEVRDTQSDGVNVATMLSAEADASVASAFRALSASVQLTSSEAIDRHVRDMLRPMLKQWLDDNLPVMVERMVRAEIERVARGGR